MRYNLLLQGPAKVFTLLSRAVATAYYYFAFKIFTFLFIKTIAIIT
jgi:hypothetical protein